MLHLLIVLASIWIFYFLVLDMKKPKNFPRGPFFYPIIGNIITLDKLRKETGYLVTALEKIANRYPNTQDVLGLKIGKDHVVFTLSMKAYKEVYLNQDFDGRPIGPFYETRTWNKRRGIIFTDQEFWQAQHRFIVRQLKDFGFARKGMTEICENEAEFLINDLRKLLKNHGENSITIKMPNLFSAYILNTLWQFLAGERYDVDNHELKNLQKMLCDLMRSIDMKGALFSHFPILQYIAPEMSGYNNFVKCHNDLHKFTHKIVEKHKKEFNISDEPRDLIDAYLKVLHAGDELGKAHKSFSELQLLGVCLDLFIAGSETTNNAIDFLMLHLIRNPNIQARAREEIDKVVGRNRLPKLSDRPKLPYCDAIVHECLRIFLKMACGIPHRAIKDTMLCGFNIPKDTMIISLLNVFTLDENLYKNPYNFDPNHFLDENGNLFVPENFVAFGLGKRRCIGEMMAKTNLFLFCVTLLQNFNFETPKEHELPSEDPIDSITPSVKMYEATISLRK